MRAAASSGVAVAFALMVARASLAATPSSGDPDGFDDPKIARETPSFLARAKTEPSAAVAGPVAAPPVTGSGSPSKDAVKEPAKDPAPGAGKNAPPAVAAAAPVAQPAASVTAKASAAEAPAAPESSRPAWPYTPTIKVGYRRFPFARIPATVVTSPAPATPMISEVFDSVSLDIYPMSEYVRSGLSTQFGWESAKFDRTGDYFIAESATLGVQIPGRFTPFLEGFAGAGYMRRMQPTGALPTAYWQTGIDAGVEIYVAKRSYVSVSVGYLHPGNLFVIDKALMSVKMDTWSLKIGLGI